jgi:RNA polymerase subunit RPABC4/transcription elongation factor Spt4
MKDNNEKFEILQGTLVSWMDTSEKMEAAIHSLRSWRKKTMTYQEMMEACLECKELTSKDMESEAKHWEVPKEHATVETGRAPNKRRRGQNLAEKRCQVLMEQTRGNCGSQKKLVAKETQKG